MHVSYEVMILNINLVRIKKKFNLNNAFKDLILRLLLRNGFKHVPCTTALMLCIKVLLKGILYIYVLLLCINWHKR